MVIQKLAIVWQFRYYIVYICDLNRFFAFLLQEELPSLEAGSDEADQIGKHFENTIIHLKVRREANDGNSPSYKTLVLP